MDDTTIGVDVVSQSTMLQRKRAEMKRVCKKKTNKTHHQINSINLFIISLFCCIYVLLCTTKVDEDLQQTKIETDAIIKRVEKGEDEFKKKVNFKNLSLTLINMFLFVCLFFWLNSNKCLKSKYNNFKNLF